MARPAPDAPTRVTRDDIERQLASIQRDMQRQVQVKKPAILTTGLGIAAVVLIIVFLVGRRAGKKQRTVVEIRRF
jgi:hypothetical protein